MIAQPASAIQKSETKCNFNTPTHCRHLGRVQNAQFKIPKETAANVNCKLAKERISCKIMNCMYESKSPNGEWMTQAKIGRELKWSEKMN